MTIVDKEFRTRLEGEINIDRWQTKLRAGVENIKNYTYFNQQALPQQHGGNIQVLSAILEQNVSLRYFSPWQRSELAKVKQYGSTATARIFTLS